MVERHRRARQRRLLVNRQPSPLLPNQTARNVEMRRARRRFAKRLRARAVAQNGTVGTHRPPKRPTPLPTTTTPPMRPTPPTSLLPAPNLTPARPLPTWTMRVPNRVRLQKQNVYQMARFDRMPVRHRNPLRHIAQRALMSHRRTPT